MDGAMTTLDWTSMAGLLAGRVAIVTGASGGVGRGLARALALSGARVVVAARSPAGGPETVALIEAEGGRALFVATDVCDADAVRRTVEASVQAFGGLDIVVHNAASTLARPTPLEDIDDALWAEQAGVSLDALHHLAHAALPHLRDTGRGRFLVLSSAQGQHGGAMNPAYTALKAAQRGFVKALAREWGPYDIVVNALAPAALTDAAKAYLEADPERTREAMKSFPLGRMGDMRDDIGPAAVAMCSDLWRYVTGQTINVDGGYYTAL
jgi:NAD(P)-dependent dehydrogenase (short-subunit alcohol dehydrogenase family)